MDKNKYRTVGIKICQQGLVDCIIKFLGDVDTSGLIEIVSDDSFNELAWLEDCPAMLKENGIEHVMCSAEKITDIDETVIPEARGWEEEESYSGRIRSLYDIYIELISDNKEECGAGGEMAQYVYIYSSQWNEAKCIMHRSGGRVGFGEFWAETFVSMLKYSDDRPVPTFRMDMNFAGQDRKLCVPYYDKYIMLKYIRDINTCNDLRDYAEDETNEKMVRIAAQRNTIDEDADSI